MTEPLNDPILVLEHLTLGYGARTVLSDVTFSIHEGDFWFFLGPNGQGKTTLLSALMGVLAPRQGRLLRKPGLSELEQIGYVPQRSEPNPSLPTTVSEFVSLGFVGIPTSRRDRDERLSEALKKVALEGSERRSFWSLSGGERQRTLVARALVRRPRVLLVDEPTNHLDPVSEHRLLETLGKLNRHEKISIVFVTHDLAIAGEFASHVALFHQGQVEAADATMAFNAVTLQRTFGVPFSIHRDPGGPPIARIEVRR